jgi:hypothetical protein
MVKPKPELPKRKIQVGRRPTRNYSISTNNIVKYTTKMRPIILPYITKLVDGKDKKFFNTHAMDEELLIIYPKWKNVTRSLRIVIIYNILTGDDFGFKKWSGKIKKVLYRPDPSK